MVPEALDGPGALRGAVLFRCQQEAVATLTWPAEAPATERVGIDIVCHGGGFLRRYSRLQRGQAERSPNALRVGAFCDIIGIP